MQMCPSGLDPQFHFMRLVEPTLLAPSCSESSIPNIITKVSTPSFYQGNRVVIPAIIKPGATSLVPLTIAGSERFMSRPLIFPSSFNKPALTSRFAENAPCIHWSYIPGMLTQRGRLTIGPSCPVAEITTGAVMTFGSMHDWVS